MLHPPPSKRQPAHDWPGNATPEARKSWLYAHPRLVPSTKERSNNARLITREDGRERAVSCLSSSIQKQILPLSIIWRQGVDGIHLGGGGGVGREGQLYRVCRVPPRWLSLKQAGSTGSIQHFIGQIGTGDQNTKSSRILEEALSSSHIKKVQVGRFG